MKILVYGQGKSGTTALYAKVKNSWNVAADYLFEPATYAEPSSSTRNVLAKVILSPVMGVDYESFSCFEKKLLIVRDPRDNLISRVLYGVRDSRFCHDPRELQLFVDLLRRKEDSPGAVSLREVVDLYDSLEGDGWSWNELAEKISAHSLEFRGTYQDEFLVRYEEFVVGRLEGLPDYLGIELSGSSQVEPELSRVERTKASGGWRSWMIPSDIDFYRSMFLPYLKGFAYEDDWELETHPVIEPAFCSDYVRRIANEVLGMGQLPAPGAEE